MVRKGNLAKKQKYARHSFMQDRAIIAGWSLMQLAALEQPVNLKILVGSKPVWLKKNAVLSYRQLWSGAALTPHYWNSALFSNLYTHPYLNFGFYRNLKLLNGGRSRNDFYVKHLNVSKFLYFAWLSIYFRAAFLKKRRKGFNTTALANTLFYENLIPLTSEKSPPFWSSEDVWIGGGFPPLPSSLPLSVRSLSNLLYPFFLTRHPFYLKSNYQFTRYFFEWWQSLVYFDAESDAADSNYLFFSPIIPAGVHLARKLASDLPSEVPVLYKIFESVNEEFVDLTIETGEEAGATLLLSAGGMGLAYSNVKSMGLSAIPYKLFHQWFKRPAKLLNAGVFTESLYRATKILKLDVNSFIRRSRSSSVILELGGKGLVKFFRFNVKNYSYTNLTTPIWLFLKILCNYVGAFLNPIAQRIYFLMFLHYFLGGFWTPIKFVPYLFYIRIIMLKIFLKKCIKCSIFFDLISYFYITSKFLVMCLRALGLSVPLHRRSGAFYTSFSRASGWLGLVLVVIVGLIIFNSWGLVLLLLLVEVVRYFYYCLVISSSSSVSDSRSVDVLTGLLRTNFQIFAYWAKSFSCWLVKYVEFRLYRVINVVIRGLYQKIDISLRISLFNERSSLNATSFAVRRFDFKSSLTLMQSLVVIGLFKRCGIIFVKQFSPKFFFDILYSAFVLNPVLVFWLYFSFFLNFFGGFGWWLGVLRTASPNYLVIQAMYFTKILQQSLTLGYRTLERSALSFTHGALGMVAVEALFIHNYLNPYYLKVAGVKMLGLSTAKKMFSARITKIFVDLLGERALAAVFAKKSLVLFFNQMGLQFFYMERRNFLKQTKIFLFPYKVVFFFVKTFFYFIRVLSVICSISLLLGLLSQILVVLWALMGYAILKFFWLYILASSLVFFCRNFFLIKS